MIKVISNLWLVPATTLSIKITPESGNTSINLGNNNQREFNIRINIKHYKINTYKFLCRECTNFKLVYWKNYFDEFVPIAIGTN
jgi:hypothetical protein